MKQKSFWILDRLVSSLPAARLDQLIHNGGRVTGDDLAGSLGGSHRGESSK